MLFANARTENTAIQFILWKNKKIIIKALHHNNRNKQDINTILNDGLIILINNIKKLKFKGDSSIHSYYIGICKILSKKLSTKKMKLSQESEQLDHHQEKGELSALVENFERLNANKERLKLIYSLVTEKCIKVLDLWARGYNMEEIRVQLGYKNTQIVMNKKNSCLKRIHKQLEERKS